MRGSHQKGTFITFEGIDGCGKSTQAAFLRDWFVAQGRTVVLTREPGDWSQGSLLRELLLEGAFVHDQTELFLFVADRCEHLAQVVFPALSRGDTVICDRYVDSTVAYQCFGRGQDRDFVRDLFRRAAFPMPDRTLWVDLPVSLAMERVGYREGIPDRLEENRSLIELAARGFRTLCDENPQRVWRIDGVGTPHEVFSAVLNALGMGMP
ncbi:MAG: dTMP kinase [Dethiosulfovibrio peptidovorans]|nr:MAG: dTMP kinase [Dethiosulfovibrio peptidovorans]